MLLAELPATSRLAVAVRGPDTAGWDTHAYLLAAAVDAINAGAYVTAQAHSKRKLARPAPLPRPGTPRRAETRRVVRVADIVAAHRGTGG